MSQLHHKLHNVDIQIRELKTKREKICKEIHVAAQEEEEQERLKFKTVLQNGDYGIYNNKFKAIIVGGRGSDKHIVDEEFGFRFDIKIDSKEKESFFKKCGNVFEILKNEPQNFS